MACGNMVGSKASRSTKNPRKPRRRKFPDFRGRRSKRVNHPKPLRLQRRKNRSFLLREMHDHANRIEIGGDQTIIPSSDHYLSQYCFVIFGVAAIRRPSLSITTK